MPSDSNDDERNYRYFKHAGKLEDLRKAKRHSGLESGLAAAASDIFRLLRQVIPDPPASARVWTPK